MLPSEYGQGRVEVEMKSKRKKFWSGSNRFRLMLTVELAVMLQAAALI
jgi:hypothetical protein